jgi:hypothetical protein
MGHISPSDHLAPGGQSQLLPPLHVGFSSATRSLRRPPELEATKRHPSAVTSNRNTHDPVTRRLHRQHLVHRSPTPTVCSGLGLAFHKSRPQSLGTHLFRTWSRSEGGEVRERALGARPPPGPWPAAAPGGAEREGGAGGALHRPYYLLLTTRDTPSCGCGRWSGTGTGTAPLYCGQASTSAAGEGPPKGPHASKPKGHSAFRPRGSAVPVPGHLPQPQLGASRWPAAGAPQG